MSAKTVVGLRTVWQPTEIEIEEVTILSEKEFTEALCEIPLINNDWWLRNDRLDFATIVYCDMGDETLIDSYTDCCAAVRPVLKIKRPAHFDLRPGDKMGIASLRWTAIDRELLLCDDHIGYTEFRKDYKAPDAGDYAASDVKQYLDSWAKMNGLID